MRLSSAPAKRLALVNPSWDFSGSRYWGCPENHLPLELLYSEALLRADGANTLLVDAHLEKLGPRELRSRVESFHPDLIVVTTAPSYLFWRCPPPELEIPAAACGILRGLAPVVAVGPHGSATPGFALSELGCDAVVRGEPEWEIRRIAAGRECHATAWAVDAEWSGISVEVSDVRLLPTLDYAGYPLEMRSHRHHLFWGEGRGAEVEFSRGCPYGCGFCNRRYFRGRYRERPVHRVLAEMRALRDRGFDYVYFIDEVFGLGSCGELLDALAEERILSFGCETRIDLWDERRLDRLAAAGCISLEFGLESPFEEVQASVSKGYRIDGERILELMLHAKSGIPWVQGDLIRPPGASADLIGRTEEWRQKAIAAGVWVSEPVDIFLYPGSELHEQLLGPVDDRSWIRATGKSG